MLGHILFFKEFMENKPILYLGLSMRHYPRKKMADHYPVIRIVERKDIDQYIHTLHQYTHILFTSQVSVDLFFKRVKQVFQTCIAVGPFTSQRLEMYGVKALYPKIFTQEGLIDLLTESSLEGCSFFLPRSSIARRKIDAFLSDQHIPYTVCSLYDIKFQMLEPIPNLLTYQEIVFTSPSTVESFFQIFKQIPKTVRCTCIGPITQKALLQRLS